ncbi:ArsR/SmtB family transcription factor [Sphingomonas hengshuiensis]|nr:helix-turn-helix domain-containing protein [Sphingomonas hengshuiensis]
MAFIGGFNAGRGRRCHAAGRAETFISVAIKSEISGNFPDDSSCNGRHPRIAVRPVKEEMIAAVDRATLFLKALSGRSRLLLLCHLLDGEKSVGELARLAGARDTAVSQQLALLRRENMVTARRSGQMIFYSLASPEARHMLEALHALFGADATPDAAA